MARDKRFMARRRQRRRRKAAKGKVKLYDQGKLAHEKLPALAKQFLKRRARAQKSAQ